MISTTTIVLIIVFTLINSGLLLYFIRKYQETTLRTTLYWALTYSFFVAALISSVVVIVLGTDEIDEVLTIQLPFVLLGLTSLALSAISTGIFGENSKPLEIAFAVIGLIGFILYFTTLNTISTVVFILMSIFAVLAYFYLAYTGSNPRIAIISVGLLIQAISGRLSTSGLTNPDIQLILNSIGQIAIAVGLLGIGLKSE